MILKSALRITLAVFSVGLIAWIACAKDEIIQVNTMTGASRTKTSRAYFFQTPWLVKQNWVAESADRQGIRTEAGWQQISHIASRILYQTRACSRAPASCSRGVAGPGELELESPEQIDRFVRDFTAANESDRRKMLQFPFDRGRMKEAEMEIQPD